MPHAHCAVAGAGEEVEVVWVEGYAVDVVVVADVETERLDPIGRPEASGAVVGASEEVMSEGTPLQVPDRTVVPSIGD